MRLTEEALNQLIRHNTHGGVKSQQKLIQIILENQEKAEKWDSWHTLRDILIKNRGEFETLIDLVIRWEKQEQENKQLKEIVERLKSRVDYLNETTDGNRMSFKRYLLEVLDEILEPKKKEDA